MRKALIALAAAFTAAFTFAEGESLAETGGFVPTAAPALAFKNIKLADLGVTVFPAVKKSGGWAGGEAEAPLFCRSETREGSALASISYQAQWYDGGFIKAATIEFTEGVGGVYAQLTGAKAIGSGVQAAYGTDFTGDRNAYTTDSADGDGYALRDLRLVTAGDVDSISLNFFHSTYKLYGTADVGPSAYAVNVKGWSQMVGENGSLNGLTLVGDDNGTAFYPALAATATISGTRGSYSYGSYSSTSSLLYGYIDEDANNTTPTVTISNVPFEFYKVVFYASTDNADIRFGYASVNGVNYNSGNSDKDDTKPYETTTGTAEWGKSQVTDYIEGVNYLVTPVLAATSDGSVKVVGHKQNNGRGCIAAVQIIKETVPEIASTDITAAQINAVVPSGESFLKVPAGATVTLDEALAASKVKFVSDGTITLSANGQPSAEELAKLDFANVKGSVLRSWLTPDVVGFNFNADGGREDIGTEDSCSDTSLALEIGTWCKNGHNQSGSSTEMFADGLSTLTWSSRNVYAEAGDIADGTFIQGYLDDGQNVSITLSAVPYETYDLIIYCSTDNSSAGFKAKTVNGTIYTWNATAGEVTTTSDVNAKWGLASQAAGKAVYGANTIRINGLTGRLSILGGTNSNGARGCISAIQIMPAGTSTAPTMTVGTDGEATAAAWTDSTLWEGGVIPSSGTAKIVVAGDVTLTIDETVSLSAVTVEGSGSLKLVTGDGASVAFDSLSSASVQIVLPDDSISIPTLSAPVKYLYKTGTIASSAAGNTYTQGAGTSEAAVTITHNGGLATLTGGTYYLGESMNATATTVDFVDATVVYASALSLGTATYVVEGVSSITAPRIVLSNGDVGRTSVMTLKDSASVTITGGVDGDTNKGNMFGHWNGPSTFTIQDNATFTCANYEILVGRTANTQTININGGVFTTKGIMVSGQYQGTYALNMNGGVLALGSLGIGTYHAGWTIPVTVSGANEIRATAETLPIGPAVTLAQGSSLAFTKEDGVETSTVTLASISGTGSISVGAGVTLNVGTNRPEGQITVDEDGVLAIVMADKSDAPVLHVTAQPATVKLYAVDGVTEYADATVEYDSEAGTITVKAPRPIWNATTDSAFDTVGNWSSGNLPGNGQDVTVNFASDTDMTVSGTYTLGDLAFTGSGNATVSGEGSIEAASYDFSATTGRIEHKLSAGSSPVISGANTVLSGGGSGTPTVAAGKTLTLGPWGTTEDNTTYTCALFQPAVGSTLIFAPGEGKIQKSGGFGGTNPATTIGVTNGTLAVNMSGGNDSVFFGANSVRIDNGGILSLEAQDALGYGNARTLTINKGGVLAVKVRDTLRRTVNFYGGSITIEGANSDRGLDFYGCEFNVFDDSSVNQLEAQSTVMLRRGETIINVSDGKSLALNCNITAEDANKTILVQSASGSVNQNGAVVVNGYTDSSTTPRQTFNGVTTIGASGRAVMYDLNCEHENGTYVVNAGSRLMGSGSITGNGGVTLAAANSKICGSLTVNNVTATSGGTYGDQWNTVAAKVVGSFFAAGIQTVQNGSFTIGKDCVVTNAAGTADTTAAAFSIAANGNLRIEKNLAVAGLTVADGGTITLVASKSNSVWDVPELTVAGEPSYPGTVNVVLDFGESNPPAAFKVKLPTGVTTQNVTVSDSKNQRRWRISSKDDDLYATSDGSFVLSIF